MTFYYHQDESKSQSKSDQVIQRGQGSFRLGGTEKPPPPFPGGKVKGASLGGGDELEVIAENRGDVANSSGTHVPLEQPLELGGPKVSPLKAPSKNSKDVTLANQKRNYSGEPVSEEDPEIIPEVTDSEVSINNASSPNSAGGCDASSKGLEYLSEETSRTEATVAQPAPGNQTEPRGQQVGVFVPGWIKIVENYQAQLRAEEGESRVGSESEGEDHQYQNKKHDQDNDTPDSGNSLSGTGHSGNDNSSGSADGSADSGINTSDSGSHAVNINTVNINTGVISDQERKQRYADGAFRTQLLELERTPAGQRNETCYTSALKLGNFIGEGFLNETDVREGLLSAMRTNGYVADKSRKAALDTIRSGIKNGKNKPVTWPQEWSLNNNSSVDPELANDPSNWGAQFQYLINPAVTAGPAAKKAAPPGGSGGHFEK